MSEVFVVQQRNFEYNDEYYSSTEGGNAIFAFNNEADANAYVIRKTIEDFDNDDYYMFEYLECNDLLRGCPEELEEELNKTSFGEDSNDYNQFFQKDWKNLPYWAKMLFVSNLYNPVYFVQKVPSL